MSLEYIRNRYGVSAYRGQRIRYTGDPSGEVFEGSITAGINGHIRVRFDDQLMSERPVPCHPTWKIEYLNPRPKRKKRRPRAGLANCDHCGKFMKWTGGFYTCTKHGNQP